MNDPKKGATALQVPFSDAKQIAPQPETILGDYAAFERAALFIAAFAQEDLPQLLGGVPKDELIVGVPVELNQPIEFRMKDFKNIERVLGIKTRSLESVNFTFFAHSNEPDANFPRYDRVSLRPKKGDGIVIETGMPAYHTLGGKTFMRCYKDEDNNWQGLYDEYSTTRINYTRDILEAALDGMRRIQEHRDQRGDRHAGVTPGALADALQLRMDKSFDLDTLSRAQQTVVITPDLPGLKK